MKVFLLQVIALTGSIAAVVGLKKMDMSGWFTFPLLAILMLLAVLGIILPYRLDRK